MTATAAARTLLVRPTNSPDPIESSLADERRAIIERDAALVRRVREGDSSAFDEIVKAYMRQVFQVAYRVVGHREDAEDLRLGVFVVAQLEEIVPLSRRHDDVDMHEGFEQAINNLLVITGAMKIKGILDSLISCGIPGVDSAGEVNLTVFITHFHGGVMFLACLHTRLVFTPVHRHRGVSLDILDHSFHGNGPRG